MMRGIDCESLGVPVYWSDSEKILAQARGIRYFKRIVVGGRFFLLPPRHQKAILYHEAGHCAFDHVEKRLRAFWMIFFPRRLSALLHQQEFEADTVARAAGLGPALAEFLQRHTAPQGPIARFFHPSVIERVSRLI